MSFGCQKAEFDRPVKESRPDRQLDRFPSLMYFTVCLKMLKFLVVFLLVLDSLVSRFYLNLIPTKISFLKMYKLLVAVSLYFVALQRVM